MAEKQLKVVISSTVLDLPDYRKAAMDACLERDIHPKMMEHLTALNAVAIKASLDLVDQADVYIGIFAHRYGYVPTEDNPQKISITEMEYNRAVEFDVPQLIFLIKENYPFDPSLVDKGGAAVKLQKLKKRLATERVVKSFTSPEDLRAHIISALAELEKALGPGKSTGGSGIPAPPEEYVAHLYTLLQTDNLIGRKAELDRLNEWAGKPDSDVYRAHILNIIAMGGMGKSALTWKWFNEIAPQEMKPLAGRMWWSFYELDARFENFLIHALSYVSGILVEEVRRRIPAPERETRLLTILNKEPFLLVFDGFERELVAYERTNVSHLDDSEAVVPKNLRKTSDPRVGQFLKKLTQMRCSRVLISTRLLPAELETDAGLPLPGVFRHDLESLPDDEAVEMWQKLGVEGPRNVLLPVFRSFGKHTLVIQALAGEVVKFRRGPGNFEKWLEANPTFDLTKFDNVRDKVEHVLEFAVRGLDVRSRTVLATIIAFRLLPDYDTLSAVLTGEGKPCVDERELDTVLTELEDRGLVGWDKRANRYDLHPIVRSVVWSGLGDDAKQGVYAGLHAHFETVPMIENYLEVNSLEDLTPAVELYHTLIGMGRYDDACRLFNDRLDDGTLYRLSANRQRVEMLEMLLPDGLDKLPRLNSQSGQRYTLSGLAQGYQLSGQPGRAVPLLRSGNTIALEMGDDKNFAVCLRNMSDTLRLTGGLRESEEAARQSLEIARRQEDRFSEAVSLDYLGRALVLRGDAENSRAALLRSLKIQVSISNPQGESIISIALSQRAIWFREYAEALEFAGRGWDLANVFRMERDFIRAARVQGEAARGLGELDMANERLHHALTRARAVNLVEEELPALVALAELKRRQEDLKVARENLDDIWEYAEHGPYPLFQADALNVLARIEQDEGNTEKAIKAATKAYELAWRDGPPYAYHWGLIKAQKHLEELGAPLPEMPIFDESKFEPMPEIEINPKDEFYVEEAKDEQ